jgi:hypothetical protein
MANNSEGATGSEATKRLLKDYFVGVRNFESAPLFSFVSLLLSILFASKVFNLFVLNVLYLVNISFFALIVRDGWEIRRKNSVSLVSILISIVLCVMPLIDLLKAIDALSVLRSVFGS